MSRHRDRVPSRARRNHWIPRPLPCASLLAVPWLAFASPGTARAAPALDPGLASLSAAASGAEQVEGVHPYGRDVPAEVRDFLASAGRNWVIHWDRVLETPRLVYPRRPFALPRPQGVFVSEAEVVEAVVLDFVDRHRDFLGIAAADLGIAEVVGLDGGHLFTAHQEHGGMPVRGSSVRVRLTADLELLSLRSRVVRDPAPVAAGRLEPKDVLDSARAEGFEPLGEPALQVGFPEGAGGPAALWRVAAAGSEEDFELLFDAQSGDVVSVLPRSLHWGGGEAAGGLECGRFAGRLEGFYPDPDDMYAMAFEVDANAPRPLEGLDVSLLIPSEDADMIQARVATDSAGRFDLRLGGAPCAGTYFVVPSFFSAGNAVHPDYVTRTIERPIGERYEAIYNDPSGEGPPSELGSFHLLALHHFRTMEGEVARFAALQGIDPRFVVSQQASFALDNADFEARYDTFRQRIVLENDEREPQDADGRWRKVVPTLVQHELGHHVYSVMTRGYEDAEVAEAVSDAIAGYVSRLGSVGLVDDGVAGAYGAARDLRGDVAAWPHDRRRAVAGALWEMWEKTLDAIEPEGPDPAEVRPTSSFAYGLLLRVIHASRLESPVVAGRPLEFLPAAGVDFLIEADQMPPDGNGDLQDGAPNSAVILEAFGRRNLYPHPFIRADANSSGAVDLSDALAVLGRLFLGLGADETCPDAADADDSGAIDISDPVFILNHLFLGGGAPPLPYPGCGWDLTILDGLGCWDSVCRLFPSEG